jgi:ABC-2 type transport system permease protein
MHTRNILAIARKDALDIILNKTTLFFLFTPILVAVLFAIIGSLLSSKNSSTSLLIYNPGHSGIEQYVSATFKGVPIVHAATAEDVASAFGPQGSHKNISYEFGLVVPSDFDSSVRAGNHPQVHLYVNQNNIDINGSQLLVYTFSDYARGLTNPRAPISVSITSINPPVVSDPIQDYTRRYAMGALVYSLTIGISFVPGLLVEEKEKKTIRMLMVSPASWGDIVAAKLLVGLAYQLIVSAAVLVIVGGFVGQVPLVLFFTLLGSCFGLVMGLFFGSLLQTNGTVGTFVGLVSIAYTLPVLILGPLYSVLQDTPFAQAVKVLPPYYIADGILKAMLNQATWGNILLDIVLVVGCTALLFLASIWSLRRQSAVAGAI